MNELGQYVTSNRPFTSRVVVVENRNERTLLRVIKKYVSKKCGLIISDSWKGYSMIAKRGYNIR